MFTNGLFQYVDIVYLVLCCCSGGSASHTKNITIYCVTSTNGSDNACQAYNFTEKHTLHHYMMNHSEYFKSYETYVFEGGSHIPLHHFELVINRVTNLTLTGNMNQVQSSGKAIIDCKGAPTTFNFTDSSNIIIADLNFNSCIQVHRHTYNKLRVSHSALATILFNNGANFEMLRVSILNYADEAFFIQNTVGRVIIENVEVANCSADKSINYLLVVMQFSTTIVMVMQYQMLPSGILN